jgi:hypothetical protein
VSEHAEPDGVVVVSQRSRILWYVLTACVRLTHLRSAAQRGCDLGAMCVTRAS